MTGAHVAQLIPVYLTTAARSDVRIALAAASIAAWGHHVTAGLCEVVVLDAGADPLLWRLLDGLGVRWRPGPAFPGPGTQRARHMVARELQRVARSEWAIWTDDDILPPQPAVPWLERALGALTAPAPVPWGLVSAWLPEASTRGWPAAHTPRPIAAQGAVGGLRFVRLAAVDGELPPWTPTPQRRGYDPQLCAHVRRRRFEVGIFTEGAVVGSHAGQHWSSVHPYQLAPGQPVPR